MTTPTHLLVHCYTPGTGPQEGTPELEAEMKVWAQVDTELRQAGQLVEGWALNTATATRGATDAASGPQATFAIHAIAVDSDDDAEQIAARMPHLSYGSTAIHPLMS